MKLLSAANPAFQEAQRNLLNTNLETNPEGIITGNPLPTQIGFFLNSIYAAMGTVAVVYIFWAGYKWMTSGGDPKKIGEAKDQIITAIVGIAILLLVFSITSFVIDQLTKVTA